MEDQGTSSSSIYMAPLIASANEPSSEEGCIHFIPLRCPSGPTFDLACLLQNSTEVENALLDVDASQTPSAQTPQALAPPSPSPAVPPSEPASCAGSKSTRPPGMGYQHWLRKVKSDEAYQAVGHKPRRKTLKTLIPLALKAVEHTGLACLELPATNGAYGARVSKEGMDKRVYTLAEAKSLGVRVLEWDGIVPVPLLDKDGRIFAVLAGRPAGEDYLRACEAFYALLKREGREAPFTREQTSHRRGDYPALNVGVTHGMGTLRPTLLDNGPHAGAVERILNDPNVQRVAAFCTSAFALWAPRTYAYYREHLDRLFMHTGLRRIFTRSVFPTAALNFGPNASTRKHNDGKNSPFGWCSVTPMGHFNPKAGGHLVLWDLGVAIEFPAGSTVLLPSATISHSNTALVDGDERASFTQYCSGGLFRWVDYGFQTEKDLKKNNPTLYQEILRRRPQQWRRGVELWSTVEELMEQETELAESGQGLYSL